MEPCLTTTLFIRPPRYYGHNSFKPKVKNIDSFYYFEDPIYATTSLLQPGFYGPTVVVLTGFHCITFWEQGWCSGETNLLLVHFLNLFQQVLWRYSGFCLSSWYSIIEQPTFLLSQNSSMRSFKDESLGIPALMLPLQWYFSFINC